MSVSNTFTVTPAASALLTASPASLAPSGTLTATWNDIPDPTPRDWIGLYKPGADNKDRIIWNYVSCSHTPGTAAAGGSCSFSLPSTLAAGEYELRLYSDDTFDPVLATSNRVVVAPGAPQVSLSVSPTSARAGDDVTVSWSGIANPTPTDWVGLFRQGASDRQVEERVYVSCERRPGDARASGNCTFKLPNSLREGSYEFRLFAAGGFTRLATSPVITITRGPRS
jgi:hypothetical protein